MSQVYHPFGDENIDLGEKPAQIQVQLTYSTAILVPAAVAEKWNELTNEEKRNALYDFGQKPKKHFAAGAIDEDEPSGIEFMDVEPYESWNA